MTEGEAEVPGAVGLERSKSVSMMWPVWCNRMSENVGLASPGARQELAVVQRIRSLRSRKPTFRLQIPINKPHQMQILQSGNNFTRIKLRRRLRYAFPRSRLQCSKEFAAGAVFHDEEKVVVVLEGVVEGDDEGVV